MRLEVGDARTREWLEGIKANEPKIYENNIQTEEAIARGEIDVGFVNHYYLYELKREQPNFPVGNHFLRDGDPGSLVNAAGVGVLETSERSRRRSGSSTSCCRARPALLRATKPRVPAGRRRGAARRAAAARRRCRARTSSWATSARELRSTLEMLDEVGLTS